jgi:hypothetical protein
MFCQASVPIFIQTSDLRTVLGLICSKNRSDPLGLGKANLYYPISYRQIAIKIEVSAQGKEDG